MGFSLSGCQAYEPIHFCQLTLKFENCFNLIEIEKFWKIRQSLACQASDPFTGYWVEKLYDHTRLIDLYRPSLWGPRWTFKWSPRNFSQFGPYGGFPRRTIARFFYSIWKNFLTPTSFKHLQNKTKKKKQNKKKNKKKKKPWVQNDLFIKSNMFQYVEIPYPSRHKNIMLMFFSSSKSLLQFVW